METVSTASPRRSVRLATRWWPFVAAALLALLTCRATWFLCDDAFINFRYSGNAFDGHGFVWNPAPFAPVEGYTSFLWVWLMWAVWSVTGLQPPVTAVPITFAAGLGVLWLVARASAELLDRAAVSERLRPWLAAAVLGGIALNHTFATWLSSGLETAVFMLLAMAWTLRACRIGGANGGGLTWLAVWSALALLTRPDGGLLVLATVAMAAHAWLRSGRSLRTAAFSLWPLLAPVAHFLWRRATYGEWLPNTYYAKVTAAWPESGLRYLFCFALENGVWLWGGLAAVWLAVAAVRGGVARLLGERFGAFAAVGAWLGYVGYYTLVVGGDHFAYRIFSHLVPLLFLSALAMLVSLRVPGPTALAGLVGFAFVADVPGWWLERQLEGRQTQGFARVVGRAPEFLRPITEVYDRHQAWLLLHSVGHRRALHAISCERARLDLPRRAPGQVAGSTPGMRLVWRADAVGVVGWALPDVAILDGHGLNDRVIARTPKPPAAGVLTPGDLRAGFGQLDIDRDGRLREAELAAATPLLVSVGPQLEDTTWVELLLSLGDADRDDALDGDEFAAAIFAIVPPRQMAHERHPPPGYIEALRPNVAVRGGVRQVLPDVVPLTDDELRAVEARFFAEVRR